MSGTFDETVPKAIYESGNLELKSYSRVDYKAPKFWQNYIAYQSLRPDSCWGNFSRLIRETAKYVLQYRNQGSGQLPTSEEFRRCVTELSILPVESGFFSENFDDLVMQKREVVKQSLCLQSPWFKQMLLGAAIWLREADLANHLIRNGYNNNNVWHARVSLRDTRHVLFCH